jgi:hypothetical protein
MRSIDELYAPFFVVPIPFNAAGHGPEMDPAEVVGTAWEIWDGLNLALATASTEEIARLIAQRLNA